MEDPIFYVYDLKISVEFPGKPARETDIVTVETLQQALAARNTIQSVLSEGSKVVIYQVPVYKGVPRTPILPKEIIM